MKKVKKKISAKNNSEKMIKESQVMVVLEDMNDNIKIIAEGLSATNQNLESVRQELENTNHRLDSFEDRMDRFEKETGENFKMVFSYLSKIEFVSIKNRR